DGNGHRGLCKSDGHESRARAVPRAAHRAERHRRQRHHRSHAAGLGPRRPGGRELAELVRRAAGGHRTMTRHRRSSGFTLVEMLIAVTMLSAVMAAAMGMVIGMN